MVITRSDGAYLYLEKPSLAVYLHLRHIAVLQMFAEALSRSAKASAAAVVNPEVLHLLGWTDLPV